VNKKLNDLIIGFREKKPRWLNLQNLVFVVVIIAFIVIIIWSEPISFYFQSRDGQEVETAVTPTTLPGTPTLLSEEYFASSQQTNGIISGAVIILVAILAGTAAILIRDRGK